MSRIVKGAGRSARTSRAWTMHGSTAEWSLFAQPRGREAGRSRGNFSLFALGPARVQGKATPKNPGRKGR